MKLSKFGLFQTLSLIFFLLFLSLSFLIFKSTALSTFDIGITKYFESMRNPALDLFFTSITKLGSIYSLTLITILALLFLLIAKKKRLAMYLLSNSLFALAVDNTVKPFFHRSRPNIIPRLEQIHDFSFPSGHTLGSTVIFLSIAFLSLAFIKSHKKKRLVLLSATLLIFIIGLSRIHLGVHYPTDVLGGYLLGFSCLFLTTYFFLARKKD